MAVLIETSGKTREVKPAKGRKFQLRELQGYVGGCIEAVWLNRGRAMLVNEEGQRLGLEPNPAATGYATAELGRVGRELAHAAPGILGPALVIEPKEWD